jgi:predicted nicotinamide N-methyase
VPDAQEARHRYFRDLALQPGLPFPHWTKLWPAALALADFIHQRPSLVEGRSVLELAAGLGLPSFVAARYAKSVCCSDYLDESVATMEASVRHLGLEHVECRLLDWNHLPVGLSADVLLLSDINYDPEQFERLYQVLMGFLERGTVILLASPQRLMAKPFIERILPYCREQEEKMIGGTAVSLLVLGD